MPPETTTSDPRRARRAPPEVKPPDRRQQLLDRLAAELDAALGEPLQAGRADRPPPAGAARSAG